MSLNTILCDLDLCVGCYACEVACKQENSVPEGVRWIRLATIGPEKVDGKKHPILLHLDQSFWGRLAQSEYCELLGALAAHVESGRLQIPFSMVNFGEALKAKPDIRQHLNVLSNWISLNG